MTKLIYKIFISQPMSDRTDKEIFEERDRLKQLILDNKFYIFDVYSQFILDNPTKYESTDIQIEFIDSYINEYPPENLNNPSMWYLAKSIELLSTANAILVTHDYKNYRGCRMEYEIAKNYNLTILKECECVNTDNTDNLLRNIECDVMNDNKLKNKKDC